ncbi:MAG: hypothetical protein ATN36_01420 [Epulopiscium sp. Nele67-Bin005]|nr:MAG: hypothetical protein ATN36_01420 [Epulopiscium sp. Nele67-Bin005]
MKPYIYITVGLSILCTTIIIVSTNAPVQPAVEVNSSIDLTPITFSEEFAIKETDLLVSLNNEPLILEEFIIEHDIVKVKFNTSKGTLNEWLTQDYFLNVDNRSYYLSGSITQNSNEENKLTIELVNFFDGFDALAEEAQTISISTPFGEITDINYSIKNKLYY